MKLSKSKKCLIFFFLLIALILLNVQIFPQRIVEPSHSNFKTSGGWIIPPLLIDGDGGWPILSPWCTGSGTPNDPYIIENITIDAVGSGSCLEIRHTENHFIIRNSTFLNSGIGGGSPPYEGGIKIWDTVNGTLFNNTCSGNSFGITLYNTEDITIEKNIITLNTARGISDLASQNNIICNNVIDNNDIGLVLSDVDNHTIINNTIINQNMAIGFDAAFDTNSTYNIISDNLILNHAGDAIQCQTHSIFYTEISNNTITIARNGIFLDDSCHHNSILRNKISQTTINGIHINGRTENWAEGCDNNIVQSNNISRCASDGIRITRKSDSNTIVNNKVFNNTLVGLEISEFSCRDNMAYGNYFIINTKHAEDNGNNTVWNSISIGNYWDNYTGVDINDDGIGDSPHIISTIPLIQDMLPIWEDGDDIGPMITINLPHENSNYGSSAPTYDIEIFDLYGYDAVWYTIDGGIANYTITQLTGTINQTAWNAAPFGNLTIEFYARDISGHFGYNKIYVNKIEEPKIPLELIIIISAISGGAVIGIATIFLIRRKRKSK
ncbi:MAG: nitrous oxide reductase family maturation protein NosD [Promethearchaeota archaeon]